MRYPETDPEEQLTGRELRSLTARAAAARAGSGVGEVVTTVTYAVVCLAVTVALVVGVADALRGVVTLPPDVAEEGGALSLAAVRGLLWVVLAAQAASLAARLGPVGVPGAGVRWWVPTAVDRAGLLVGSWWATLALWTAGTSVVAVLVAVVTGLPLAPGVLGLVALVGAAAGAFLVSTVGVLQSHGQASRAQAVGDALSAAVPVLGVVAVLLVGERSAAVPGEAVPGGAAPGGAVPGGALPGAADATVALAVSAEQVSTAGLGAVIVLAAVLLVVLALCAALVWRRSLGRLSSAVLSQRVGAAEHAGAAVLSLDTRELARALGRGRSGPARRTSRRLRAARGPASALLLSETLALLRTPGTLLGLAALACAAVVAQQVPALGRGAGLVVVALVVGVRAAQTGARGAQEADVVPALDALLPLGSRATRALRCILPALTSALGLLVALLPVLVEAETGLGWWVSLLLLAGAGFGAAAVRGAYRTPPDWSAPLLATPAGALPTGAVSSSLRGPDLALLVVIPVAVALVLGAATAVLVLVQGVVAVVAVLVASTVPSAR